MADWATISSMATAGGTLVLAVATFGSIRSANRSARVAELSLLAGLRPLLIPSREDDPPERVRFGDGVILTVSGHGGALQIDNDRVYMAIALRNGGTGLAVIHGWYIDVELPEVISESSRPDPSLFRRQQRDLYIPAGDTGFWQGAVRDHDDPLHAGLVAAAENRSRVMIDLLYGDHEGGQRTITRFGLSDWPDVEGERAEVMRYWNIDRDDPR
jgi:hypothetical protein